MENPSLKDLLPSEMTPPLKPFLVTDLEGLSLLVSFLERTRVFGHDIETNVTNNFTRRRIRTMQFGDREEQFIVDLLAFAGSKDALIAAQGPNPTNDCLRPVVEALRPFLESREWTKVGHNLQFEYETERYCLGIRSTGFFDTFRAEQQIWAGLKHFKSTGFWALEDVVRKYLGLVMTDVETGKTFDLETPLTEKQILYGALDARLPMGVRVGQLRKLTEAVLLDSIDIDFRAIPAFGDMHLNGVATDDPKWTALIDDNLSKKVALLKKLDEFLIPVVGTKYITQSERDYLDALEDKWRSTPSKTPEDKQARAAARAEFMKFRSGINARVKIAEKCAGEAALPYGSPQKLLAAFRKLGYNEKKLPSTGDEVLEKLAKFPNMEVGDAFVAGELQEGLPLVDLLRLFRSVDKQLSTYGYAWITDWDAETPGHRNPDTGRIHSYIDLFGTATGRTSSTAPNIQNIPKEKRYRHCFKARPGYKVITIDFNGCELRIMAEMSQEPVWLEAFAKNWDVHSVGAEILFGQEWLDGAVHEAYEVEKDGKRITIPVCTYYHPDKKGNDHQKCDCPTHKKLRNRVKSINFGLAYGMGPGKLAQDCGITYEEAIELLANYKHHFPTVMAFLEKLGRDAKTFLEAKTIIGTRRRWAKPSWETAKERAIEDRDEKVKKAEEKNPGSGRLVPQVTDRDIRWKYTGMFGSIEREGKNAPIQGTNANLSKLAMALVWERLEPEFGGLWLNMVHDELVVECPAEKAEACRDFVGACMTEAGAMWIKSLPMTWEDNIMDFWTK